MTSIEQAFFDAVLADIAYVDRLITGLTGDDLAEAIKDRISLPLAETIGKRFEVLDVRDVKSSGFQGVVFRDKLSNEIYVANRGTESVLDFIADGNLAVITGVATAQTASMINWWQQISNPAGTIVPLITAGITDQFISASSVEATGKISAALAESGGKVRVVGHSLGGHLTTIFASLFSNQVSHSSTFNGAGLFSIGTSLIPANWFVNFLRGEPLSQLANLISSIVQLPESKQDNFYAYNGLNLTTNSLTFTQIGERISLFNEISKILIYENHFMYKLTDALALMTIIQKLDPSINLTDLNNMFEASSHIAGNSNEKVLDSLRRIFLGDIKATPLFDSSDASDASARTEYHKNIQELSNAAYFKALQGKIKIELAAGSLDNLAKTQFSAMISLISLSPVVLSGTDQASQAMLDTKLRLTWGETYAQWNADKTLTPAQRIAGEANFSDAYLHDRAAMLTWIMKANSADTQSVSGGSELEGRSWYFQDLATRKNLLAYPSGSIITTAKVSHVIFGSESSDVMAGDSYTDHFYGAGGNDALYGANGDDYLEGGAGNDKLYGGNNNDQLYGNSGDDTLEGGKGNDVLYGGKGFDTYVYNVGDGNDTIVDEDKQGQVIIKRNGSTILTTTLYKESSGNIWSDASGSVKITHNSPWRLVLEDGGVIELGENFQDGDFGIHLAQLPDITTTRTIVGDLNPLSGHSTQYDPLGYVVERDVILDGLGNVVCDTNTSLPTRSDYLYDSAGNDRIQAGGGDDTINANKGGNDILEGGAGNDLVVSYGNGNNQLFGENYGEMADLVQAGEVATSINEKGDLLSAGSGTDQLYGSNRNLADNYLSVAERQVAA